MADVMTMDAALAAKKAQDSELVQLKTQVDRLRSDLTPGPTNEKKLRKACTDFETVFIGKLWEQMRATVPKDGYLSSPQSDMYRSIFDHDFAEKLANDGGIGLGDMLYGQLKDRLKNSTKSTKADGAGAVQPAPLAATPASTGESAKSETKQLNPLDAKRLNTLDAKQPNTLDAKRLNPLARPVQAKAPERPASVPGDVMADVEALARRIEDAYDRRTKDTGGAVQATGRRLAVIG